MILFIKIFLDKYLIYQDDIDAVNAKFEAQKIAFAPLSFQAARALRDLGILELVSSSRKKGIAIRQIAEQLKLSEYGIGVLMEMGLGMGIFKLKRSESSELIFTLGKIGFFLLNDDQSEHGFFGRRLLSRRR